MVDITQNFTQFWGNSKAGAELTWAAGVSKHVLFARGQYQSPLHKHAKIMWIDPQSNRLDWQPALAGIGNMHSFLWHSTLWEAWGYDLIRSCRQSYVIAIKYWLNIETYDIKQQPRDSHKRDCEMRS